MFLLRFILEMMFSGRRVIYGQYDLPKAAVFNVPNGRLRSDTGSHTSISPSKIILKKIFTKDHYKKDRDLLIYTRVERLVDEGCQASGSNMLSIEVGVVLAFPATNYKLEKCDELDT